MATTENSEKTQPGEDRADYVSRKKSAREASGLALDRFAKSFESSARRWEMIVYPSMFGFIIVAAYGFFLIYNVTRDMHSLAESMDPAMQTNMETMAQSISKMADYVATITANIDQMTRNVENMDAAIGAVNTSMEAIKSDMGDMSEKIRTLEPILVNISEMNKSLHVMNQSVHTMSAHTDVMSRDVGATSHHFVRPMSAINSFFPW
uniref:Methyl-accepting chemotaxis protein n=1 Tax=Candidatus Kentrum sp. LFY TaxID=2126342 RepID=A0A450UQ38_9GAMM|nr:MAG: hypothetical protein BECKLFY1418B_GA0070995_10618 [Candidatus Kentron sp. LFY]VFJ97226.1 MAG: hypothetical protein BECKLFY1418A_GA0070994_10689 [Candidatus Kentron sp. LFY]VFK21521.1 MAG: hypothetical protein BECKLFY1418C_GA0070996_10958 [Candidatus Kentron sp. LFY]